MLKKQSEEKQLEPWLSVTQIAKHMGVSKETVYRMVEVEPSVVSIPCVKFGKLWRFKKAEIDQWIMRGLASDFPAKRKAK